MRKSGDVDRMLAHALVKEIAVHCWDGRKAMIARVHRAITEYDPQAKISLRRVRAFWHREAAVISYSEMCTLADVAFAVSETRKGPDDA